MTRPRIGLTQRVAVVPSHGERRDCLDQAWAELLLEHDLLPVPLPNRPGSAAAYLDAFGLQAVVFTGGNDLAHLPNPGEPAPERDAFERELLDVCAARAVPTLGVCRGMQLMVDHHGGRIVPVGGHVAAPHELRLVAEHTALAARLPLGDREQVNSFHGSGVPADGVGAELLPLALAPDGTVEAVVHRTLPRCGIMWHPERAPRDSRDVDILLALLAEPAGAR